jgi:hypothetical protein
MSKRYRAFLWAEAVRMLRERNRARLNKRQRTSAAALSVAARKETE